MDRGDATGRDGDDDVEEIGQTIEQVTHRLENNTLCDGTQVSSAWSDGDKIGARFQPKRFESYASN